MRKLIRGMRAPLALLLLTLAASGVATRPLLAHESGTIRLSSPQVPVGGNMTLTGAQFTKNARLTLELRGALATLPLGRVRTDASGTFTFSFALPADARAGAYSLVVIADDGDVVGRAGLVVLAAAAPAPDPTGSMGQMPGMATGHGTPEMMNLPAGQSSSPAALVMTLLGVCVVAGAWMVHRARAAEGGAGSGGMKWSVAVGLTDLAAAGVFDRSRPDSAEPAGGRQAAMGHASTAEPSVAREGGVVAPSRSAATDHSSMAGMPSPTRTSPAQPMAGMEHGAMGGAGQPGAAESAAKPAMEPAMSGMAHAADASSQGSETDRDATEKLRRLVALLVEDRVVQARIEAQPDLHTRWQDESVKASVRARPR